MKRRKDRLKKLADFLSTKVKSRGRKKFNMGFWANSKKLSLEKVNCGTSGCALGWATVLFRRSGLVLTSVGLPGPLLWPAFKVKGIWKYGWDAGSSFFGLTDAESNRVFSPDCYGMEDRYLNETRGIKIQAVIKRLRALAA